jgi:hypothetical protein
MIYAIIIASFGQKTRTMKIATILNGKNWPLWFFFKFGPREMFLIRCSSLVWSSLDLALIP